MPPEIRRKATAFLVVSTLAFNPHLLLLSWSEERREVIPTTSLPICRQAIEAIREGKWLTDDPPIAMVCQSGNGFTRGFDCIEGYNCREER